MMFLTEYSKTIKKHKENNLITEDNIANTEIFQTAIPF